MADHITTYTGHHMMPTDPKPEDFLIEDIAHALSLICRGNGQVKSFWSVGQHCILCAREALARGLGARMALACLLHDAGESYLSDVPRPFKQEMPSYRALEARMLDIIYQKFLGSSLTEDEQRELRRIDDDLLWFDLHDLLGELQDEEAPAVHIRPDYSFRPFEEVEREYLKIYRELSDALSDINSQ